MAYPPFPDNTLYLQLLTNDYWYGLNQRNMREQWFDYTAASYPSTFTMPGGSTSINSDWSTDAGSSAIPSAQKEPRTYCHKGRATFTFTGSCLVLRTQIDSGYGTASVYIDGVQPSTIAGATNYLNTVDFNLDNHTNIPNVVQYIDFMLVDGLSDTTHTLDLYMDNAGSSNGYAMIAGFKVRGYQQVNNTFSGWSEAATTGLNQEALTLSNEGINPIFGVSLTVPPSIVNHDGTPISSPITIGTIGPSTSYTLPFSFNASGLVGAQTPTIGLTSQVLDPSGVATATSYNIAPNSTLVSMDSNWLLDKLAPGGLEEAVSQDVNAVLTFSSPATTITVSTVMVSGGGAINVMVGATVYGTLSANDSVGGFIKNQTVTGLPAGDKVITFKTTNTDPFAWTNVQAQATLNLTTLQENVVFNYNISIVPPFAPVAWFENGKVQYTPLNTQAYDYTIPRLNNNITGYLARSRFPTIAYAIDIYPSIQTQQILSQFDILIIDPTELYTANTKEWQSKGIKVLGYVSFGEEDGARVDIWDLGDDRLAPHVDIGGGPGGYAPYYRKGGDSFREFSECQNDEQASTGAKACALSNAHYYTSLGRCGIACTYDYRDGWRTQSSGGACNAGYTSANYWQRTGDTACQNSACPKYAPTNTKCPQYANGGGGGQDFSIATPTYPDQNGVWYASYTAPAHPRWLDKIQNFYLPYLFGENEQRNETHSIVKHTGTGSGVTQWVFRVNDYPFDANEPVIVRNHLTGYLYQNNTDYSYDDVTGVFNMNLVTSGSTPTTTTLIDVTYVKKGMDLDGLFMDTIDDVDVYPSANNVSNMSALVNRMKFLYPDRMFGINRGFTVYPDIMESIHIAMFESLFSDYNFDNGTYFAVTNPPDVAYNNSVIAQLIELRRQYIFDVVSVNYAANDSSGDALRASDYQQCFAQGYMCWTSTIDLNTPVFFTVNVNTNFPSYFEVNVDSTAGPQPIRNNKWNSRPI